MGHLGSSNRWPVGSPRGRRGGNEGDHSARRAGPHRRKALHRLAGSVSWGLTSTPHLLLEEKKGPPALPREGGAGTGARVCWQSSRQGRWRPGGLGGKGMRGGPAAGLAGGAGGRVLPFPSCDPGAQGRAAPWRTPEPWPRIWHSSWRRRCILGMPASCCSSRCFSSVRLRRAAESSFSNFQPPSPSNRSRCVWYFLGRERDGGGGSEAIGQETLGSPHSRPRQQPYPPPAPQLPCPRGAECGREGGAPTTGRAGG